MRRNVTLIDLGGGPVRPLARRARKPTPPPVPVQVRRLPEAVRATALDLADGDISRIVVGDDGSVTVINESRRR